MTHYQLQTVLLAAGGVVSLLTMVGLFCIVRDLIHFLHDRRIL